MTDPMLRSRGNLAVRVYLSRERKFILRVPTHVGTPVTDRDPEFGSDGIL